MKRLFYLIAIIALPIIAFFQWDRYKRFHPPTDYSYSLSKDIDTNYHDPELVMNYYLTAARAGTYARNVWKEHTIDVKAGSITDEKEQKFIDTYQQIIASARFFEQKLLRSAQLKQEGYSNENIFQIENGTFEEEKPYVEPLFIAQPEDKNGIVGEIQRLLYEKGYDIEVDGIYRKETETLIGEFQEANNLPVNGKVDIITLRRLLEKL